MKRRVKQAQVKRREIEATELVAILERARVGPLGEEDFGKLKAAVDTLVYLSEQLGTKGVSVERLRRILFGSSTEKTSRVLGEPRRKDGGGAGAGNGKRKGHGRNGAAAYRGADRVKVANTSLTAGDPCPECDKGKVYPMACYVPRPGAADSSSRCRFDGRERLGRMRAALGTGGEDRSPQLWPAAGFMPGDSRGRENQRKGHLATTRGAMEAAGGAGS
jgi:hypothetical protein